MGCPQLLCFTLTPFADDGDWFKATIIGQKDHKINERIKAGIRTSDSDGSSASVRASFDYQIKEIDRLADSPLTLELRGPATKHHYY